MNLLDRITFDPKTGGGDFTLTPIPYPVGTDPKPTRTTFLDTAPFPAADVVVVTYTVAEAHALADVLSPGFPLSSWTQYRHGWDRFEKILEGPAPARYTQSAAQYATTRIAGKTVLLVKSNLHPDTDGPHLPITILWADLLTTGARTLITTGTAGGIGGETQLGDVTVGRKVTWDCRRQFVHATFAGKSFECTIDLPDVPANMLAANADRLAPHTAGPINVTGGDVITTDFFAFDDVEDSYGLRDFDPAASAVEMDDAALPVAIAGEVDPPAWVSIRNASDPQIPNLGNLRAEDRQAGEIYRKYGYWTSINSVLTCWAVIVGP